MDLLTKEKSKQKRKGVNNQNNSVELFPVTNTWVTSSYLNYFSIKKTQLVVLKKGSSLFIYGGRDSNSAIKSVFLLLITQILPNLQSLKDNCNFLLEDLYEFCM